MPDGSKCISRYVACVCLWIIPKGGGIFRESWINELLMRCSKGIWAERERIFSRRRRRHRSVVTGSISFLFCLIQWRLDKLKTAGLALRRRMEDTQRNKYSKRPYKTTKIAQPAMLLERKEEFQTRKDKTCFSVGQKTQLAQWERGV